MKLGLVTYNIAAEWDIPTLIKNCQVAGFAAVEPRTTHAHGIEPSLSPSRRKEVRQQFEDAGIVLWGAGSACEFHSENLAVVRRNIDECKAFVELAEDLGMRGVKVRPNGLPKDVPEERAIEQIAMALQECGQVGADHGVEIWVEVHGYHTQSPAVMRRIMERCAHPNVGVCWNSNPSDVRLGSVEGNFRHLEPYIRSCHVNELWGDYPYCELFQLLRNSGYDRYTLCEVSTPLDPTAGALFMQCYRGLWDEVQQIGKMGDWMINLLGN